MRLELFDVRRRRPRQRTLRDDERGFVNSGILFFSIFFCSIRRPYITFKLPRRDKDTPLRLCNLPDLRRLGCVTPAYLEWPGWSSSSGNNCHAVHRSLSSGASLKWDLHLVPYYQPSTPARFLLIIGHWDVSHPLSSELQVWSSSSGNNYHAVYRSISSGASLFLLHSENFYLVSYCKPSCILHRFTYLGSSVSSTEKNIDTRPTKAWTAIDKLSVIWKSDRTDKMKRSFFQVVVVFDTAVWMHYSDAN